MVRGCQKKIVYLKNTGSEVFDEAYFVISEKAPVDNITECDMVEEANRILDECIFTSESNGRFIKIKAFLKSKTVPFIVGLMIGIFIILFIK